MGSLCPALKIQAFERREKEREREKRREREREETALCDAEKSVLTVRRKSEEQNFSKGERKKKKRKAEKREKRKIL